MFRTLLCLTVIAVSFLGSGLCAEDGHRIKDIKPGMEVTVKVRIGERMESRETNGIFAFTMRDDFGGFVAGQTNKDITDLRFGLTYLVTGRAVADSQGNLDHIEVASWREAYPRKSGLYALIAVGLVIIIGGLLFLMVRHRTTEPQQWGYAEIVSGPDQGKLFPLKVKRVKVGRKQDPAKCVAVVLDKQVSREHGVLIRDGDTTYYEDTNSKWGSSVEGEDVKPGQRVSVPNGGIVRLGENTVIRVGITKGGADETSSIDETAEHQVPWAEVPTTTGPSTDAKG